MVFAGLEDVTGSCEVVAFNSVYQQARDLLLQDRVLIVRGRIDHKQQGETKLGGPEGAAGETSARGVRAGERPPEGKGVRLKVDARTAPAGLIKELADIVARYPGEAAVYVEGIPCAGSKVRAVGV